MNKVKKVGNRAPVATGVVFNYPEHVEINKAYETLEELEAKGIQIIMEPRSFTTAEDREKYLSKLTINKIVEALKIPERALYTKELTFLLEVIDIVRDKNAVYLSPTTIRDNISLGEDDDKTDKNEFIRHEIK